MLILQGNNGSISLDIVGYEFSNASDYDDANWLQVYLKADNYEVSWEATDPCLLTYELYMIKDWLVGLDGNESSELTLLEGELWFKAEFNTLKLYLDFNLHPKGKNYDYANGEDECYISFDLDYALVRIVGFIDEVIEKYPERLKDKRHF